MHSPLFAAAWHISRAFSLIPPAVLPKERLKQRLKQRPKQQAGMEMRS